jgi:predicted transcriptional regulator
MSPQGPGEAARVAQELLDAGYSRKQIGQILGRNSSLVSQFFTKGKGASLVPALDAVVRAVQGGIRDVEDLRGVASGYVQRRRTKAGKTARVRVKEQIETPGHSRLARAGRQHIASGASRLRPVIDNTAAVGGKIAFTVRARKRDFVHSAGSMIDSKGLKRNVVLRRDGTEERAYGGAPHPGWEAGMDAREWQQRVRAAHGDVHVAVRDWLVETGRLHPDARITNLEIRGWKPT